MFSFDIPLLPQQVLAIAGGFLTGCSASDFGLTTNQPLVVMASVSFATSASRADTLTVLLPSRLFYKQAQRCHSRQPFR